MKRCYQKHTTHLSETEQAVASCTSSLVVLVIYAGVNALIAFLVQLLWNMVMPGLFHTPPIGYWPALALCALLSILGSLLFPQRSKE